MRVRCHASAPRASSPNGLCNNVLGDVPGPLSYVGTIARRPEKPDGRVWIQCGRADCKTWNIFESPDPAAE